MSDDLVNRLRGQEPSIINYWGRTELEQIAATEIERLEAEVSRLANLAQEGRKAGWDEAKEAILNEIDGFSDGVAIRSRIRALIPQEQGEKEK